MAKERQHGKPLVLDAPRLVGLSRIGRLWRILYSGSEPIGAEYHRGGDRREVCD